MYCTIQYCTHEIYLTNTSIRECHEIFASAFRKSFLSCYFRKYCLIFVNFDTLGKISFIAGIYCDIEWRHNQRSHILWHSPFGSTERSARKIYRPFMSDKLSTTLGFTVKAIVFTVFSSQVYCVYITRFTVYASHGLKFMPQGLQCMRHMV